MPKSKRVVMKRMHVTMPVWLHDQITEVAEADGRTVSELVRRIILNHVRQTDQYELLPNASRVGSWKRASKSLDGLVKKGKRRD